MINCYSDWYLVGLYRTNTKIHFSVIQKVLNSTESTPQPAQQQTLNLAPTLDHNILLVTIIIVSKINFGSVNQKTYTVCENNF